MMERDEISVNNLKQTIEKDEHPERLTKKQKSILVSIGAGVTSIVLASTAAVGISMANSRGGNESMPVATVPEEVQPDPAFIDRLKDMSTAEFLRLSRDEQLTWDYYWLNKYNDDYERLQAIAPNYDLYNAWTPVSEYNTDKEIIDNLNYINQMSAMTPKDYHFDDVQKTDWMFDQPYDANQGKKLLSALMVGYSPNSGFGKGLSDWLEHIDGSDVDPNNNVRFLEMGRPNFSGSNSECADVITGSKIICRAIDVIEQERRGYVRVALVPFKNQITGVDDFAWSVIPLNG